MIVVKLVFVVLLVFFAFFLDIRASVSFAGGYWSLPLWKLLALLLVVVCIYRLCRVLADKLFCLFGLKTDVRKGVDYLQEAFSGMLVKDHKTVLKSLNKAKKHLGEIPFISWLEGQL
ncbi:MAG: hypothetical protein J5821_01635, partial [Alphaproteobacteria bacterium]|nr:hypothetical protein [Alphaproteobacteria bacterium]